MTISGAVYREGVAYTPDGAVYVQHTESPTIAGTLNLTGGQIKFPATQNASSDVNTLDDYEEGTFTPTLLFGGAAVGMAFSSRGGFYTKIGNRVLCTGSIVLSAKGSSAGAATIGALPFTSQNTASCFSAPALRFTSITFSGQFQGFCNSNGTTIALEQITEAGTRSALTEGNFVDTSAIVFTLTYQTAT